VIAAADNGYGNAIGVIRAVREYIQTGVAGIHLEDQAIPKRCGHVAGRRVIPIEEAVGKSAPPRWSTCSPRSVSGSESPR
jgi:2-methylisocitrate lyase-like PEP mutase family enzyme